MAYMNESPVIAITVLHNGVTKLAFDSFQSSIWLFCDGKKNQNSNVSSPFPHIKG